MEFGKPIRKWYLRTPSTIAVVGASGSGKTTFVRKFVENLNHVSPDCKPVGQFVLCYMHWQPNYDAIIQSLLARFPECKMRFVKGWDENLIGDEKTWDLPDGQQSLLIMDDISELIGRSSAFQAIFKNLSHHKNITSIFITQDPTFGPNNYESRSGLKSVGTVVFMKFPFHGDAMQTYNKKMFPKSGPFLQQVYNNVIGQNDYAYFLIDCTTSEPMYSVKTGILPGEVPRVFIPIGYNCC
jgi:energy-coupling factor transporter ATP-binding protein EcfA2